MVISVITVAEYWKGVERADTAMRRAERIAAFERLTGAFDVVDVDQEIALAAARLWADLAREGFALGGFDLLIAATAVAKGHRVATLDVADFQRVSGLGVIDVRSQP